MTEAARVAIVGLGNMGAPMARRLITAGFEVCGSDLEQAALDRFAHAGGSPFATSADAVAGSAIVILMLPDSDIVDSVLSELLTAGALETGVIVVDMSSSDPARSRVNGKLLAAAGIGFVDAPVSGGVRAVEGGVLAVMAGGVEADVARVMPVLEAFGAVHHVGPVGAGHALKALNNLVSATHLWITSEVVLIAERFGISAHTALDVLNRSSGRSGSCEVKWPQYILPGTFDSGFGARLMLKDARIATGLADSVGLPTALGDELVAQWEKATAALAPNADHTEIARFLSDRAGGSG
jgi:3-hydroxyisobutyrate dehydrogenase